MVRRDLISIFMIVLISVLVAAEFPSDVNKCKTTDADCHKEVLQKLIEKYGETGNKPLNLIKIEPLDIKNLVLPKIPGSPVNIELTFKDVRLTGISDVEIHKLSGLKEVAPGMFVYEAEATFKQIVLNGPYSVDGQVLVLAITGQGTSRIVFDNVAAKIKAKCSLVERDGKKYLNVDKVALDLQPKKTTFAFDNLFNGDAALGENMNKFLNENWVEVFGELKPVIMEAISKILLHIANGVYSKNEFSELFLPA